MKTSKSTKFAMLSTVLCLVLCAGMLLGSTYAWFTDSVNNDGNIIQSGTLDIEMSYSDALNGEYTDASQGKIFDYTLWEPGYTDVKYVKIENKGSLALKYTLDLLSDEAANDDGVKLSDVIEVYFGTDVEVSSRSDVTNLDYVGTLADLMADPDGAAYGILYAGQSQTYCIALHMKEEAGNEYQNLSIGSGIAVKLFATQFTFEEDSFGPDYDGNAGLPVADVKKAPISNIVATMGMGGNEKNLTLDTAFSFKTTETYAEAQASDYKYWHADFVVSADQDVPASSLALAGYYAAYCEGYNKDRWVALMSDEAIPANTEIRLLDLMLNGGSMSYQELCNWVPEFLCGAVDLTGANEGTTLNVELRLYEVEENTASTADETGKYVTIGVYTHTFTKDVPADLPSATVTNLDVPAQKMYIIPDITQGFGGGENIEITLDAAFTFAAQDNSTTIADSPYKDWLVDYYVSVNAPVEAGIILAGSYGNWENGAWYGFNVPAGNYTTAVPLLGTMTGGTSNWTYEEIVTGVNTFNCGVVNDNDSNNGKVMTVELRIMNPANTAEYYVISSTSHTFQ